jgi:PST family polysaccharide transporter
LTPDNLKSKAVKGAGINVVAQFLGLIAHTVGVIVLARLLQPKDFGQVAMVTAFSLWFMNFGVNGFPEFIIQKKQISDEEINSIFWLHVIIATVLALGFTFLGFFLVYFYSEPALWGIAVAMSTSFVLMALSTSHLALLKRDMKFTSIACIELIAVIMSIVFSVAAAVGGMSYWAVVIRQLTLPVVSVIGAWILCPWRPGYPTHLSLALPGLKYAVQVYGNFSIGYLTRNIDKVLLGKYHGAGHLGNYDRAYHLSSLPANQLLSPLHSVALATLSRLTNDKERFIKYYTKAVAMVTFLGTLAALILTLSAETLIAMLLGPTWSDAGPVVMAFGPGIAAMLIYGTHTWLHLSLGTPNRWLRWNIFASIITIAAFLIAAPYGAVAMAVAYSATLYILVVPALWYAGRPIGFTVKTVLVSLWSYFASALLTGILWLYLSAYWPPLMNLLANLILLNRVLMTSLIATLLYIAIVILLQRGFRSIREITSFIGIFLSRKDY